ncbi:MAG TPA: hypothetical protein VMT52_17475 [Planctomycetota bacterium]|nr:hypothetical protein [Planctomycetota bacterium]
MARGRRGKPVGVPRWFFTYSDIMSLLLVVFIFASTRGGVKFRRFESGVSPRGGVALAEEGAASNEALYPSHESAAEDDDTTAIFPMSIAFGPGSDELTSGARDNLRAAAPALSRWPVPLVVVGYVSPWFLSDAAPPPADPDRLGFARALAVVSFLAGDTADHGILQDRKLGYAQFLPGSGGYHAPPVRSPLGGRGDGRDRVDIYPVILEGR